MFGKSFLYACLASAVLAACSDAPIDDSQALIDIAPEDFVVLPCGNADTAQPCALTVAGGKRIAFGAPAGAAASFRRSDLELLDAVIIFSLRAGDLQGLDELRNESWRAGRSTPLLVIGPSGIEDVVEAINKAFEQSDALRIVEEGIPPGGYDAAIIEARSWAGDQIIFDTGDVQIRASQGGFEMIYNGGAVLTLDPCGTGEVERENALQIGCSGGSADAVWPLSQPVIVVQKQ